MSDAPPTIDLRPATVSDIDKVYEFIKPFVATEELLPRSEVELALLFQNGFVAARGDEIVGCAAVEIYSVKMAELQCLAVSPDCRGLGIGRKLVTACVQRARDKGVLELMAITASERLFQDCGFDYSLPNQKRALFIQTGNRK